MRLFFCFLFLIRFALWGQNGLVTNINTDQGLPTLTVYSSYCDSHNRMWFCTDKGLSIYNGKTMQNFDVNNGLPDNEVFSVFEDNENRIWPATLKGELFYLQNGKIYTKKNDLVLRELNGLINHKDNNYINNVFQIKDTIYFCSSFQNIYKLSRDGKSSKINTKPKDNIVTCIFDSNNKIYWFTDEGICELYTGKLITPFKQERAFESRFVFHKNIIYFAYKNKIYTVNQTTIEPFYELEMPEQVTGFNFLTDETLVICSQNNLYTYDLSQKKLAFIRAFKNTNLCNIKVDKEQNCWISSLDKGVFLVNNFAYKFYAGIPTAISQMIEFKDRIFLGYIDGSVGYLNIKTGEITEIFNRKEKETAFQSGHVRTMAIEDSAYLWIGYNDQTIKYNLKNGQIRKIPHSVKTIETDAKGKTWATLFGNIVTTEELEKKQYTSELFSAPDISNYRFYSFCEDSLLKQYYISRDNLFIHYKNEILKTDTLDSRISKIKTKNGQLFWILSQDKGLHIYDRKKLTFIPIHTADNLPTTCNDFYLVNDSTLWVAYSAGYSKIEINVKTKQIKKHTPYELIINTSQTNISKILYKNGTIFLSTQHDLVSIKEKELKMQAYDVPVSITGKLINGKPVELKSEYELSPSETDINVEYMGLYYQKFGHINYRYKFGNDTNWRYTNLADLEFPKLAPGTYKLILNAADEYDNWSKHYAYVSFVIKEPFYKTYLFTVLLFVLITGSSVFLFNKSSENKLEQKKQELDLKNKIIEAEQKAFIAQVNPHFVFNAINSIQHYILKQKPKEAYAYLGKFSLLMRNILIQSKTQLTTLQEDYENLKLYLELEVLRFDQKLNFEIIIDENIDPSKLMPPMLVQPYVENSIWHGIMPKPQGGNIKIHYSTLNSFLIITITDDGIGREAAKKIKSLKTSTGSGLVIAERRLKLYSEKKEKLFKIEFIDLYNENKIPTGTQVILTIPI
jgi:ligand-binding sensor domain-containing protein